MKPVLASVAAATEEAQQIEEQVYEIEIQREGAHVRFTAPSGSAGNVEYFAGALIP